MGILPIQGASNTTDRARDSAYATDDMYVYPPLRPFNMVLGIKGQPPKPAYTSRTPQQHTQT